MHQLPRQTFAVVVTSRPPFSNVLNRPEQTVRATPNQPGATLTRPRRPEEWQSQVGLTRKEFVSE